MKYKEYKDMNVQSFAQIPFSLALLLFLLMVSCQTNTAENPPLDLSSCDIIRPVGTEGIPWFGWHLDDPDDNEIQTAYQVMVAASPERLSGDEEVMWNSGKVNSRMQNHVTYEGSPLEAASRYYWKVRTWDRKGKRSPWSGVEYFDTGLLENSDWSGALWIRGETAGKEVYTCFRRQTEVIRKPVHRAMVYLSAAHDYELYLNGTQVGKGPAYHYPQYQYYQAYDITELIPEDEALQFACLTHWYGKGQGRPENAPGLILKCVIEFSDSSLLVLGSDASWKQTRARAWQEGQERRNGEVPFFVESIDAREIMHGWKNAGFEDSSWEAAVEIGPHPTPPWTGIMQPNLTRLKEKEIAPATIRKMGDGSFLIDLGRVYAGVPRIHFKGGKSGQRVLISGGYTLEDDGSVSAVTKQNTNMDYFFTLDGGDCVFEPMGYLGMRFILVENAPCELDMANCSFMARHYELEPERAAFHSSDTMLNKVWELMKHSLLLGSQEGFVDTPTREQGPFLGDSWSTGVAAMTCLGDRTMNQRTLLEFLDSQDQYWPDGRMNAVYPNGDGARDIPDYTQMYLVWAWDYYMHSGDLAFLRENYDKLAKVAGYVDSYRDERTGLIHQLAGGGGDYLHGIVDWPPQMRYGYDMSVDSRTVIDAYAWLDFEIMARIAGELEHTGDRDRYRQMASDVKVAINRWLVNDRGVYVDGLDAEGNPSAHVSQQANIFPLALGLVPDENQEAVIREIKARKMSVGMVTLRWLPEALGQAGEGAHLLELYTNPEWDGWAQTIAKGGTATWECWNADTCGQSLSHPWGTAGLLGIYNYILGVTILEPQHQLIRVQPLDFGPGLEYAEGSLSTDRGEIFLRWSREDSSYQLNLDIPDNVKAEVYLPSCESDQNLVKAGDWNLTGKREGESLYLGTFGSGKHLFTREL